MQSAPPIGHLVPTPDLPSDSPGRFQGKSNTGVVRNRRNVGFNLDPGPDDFWHRLELLHLGHLWVRVPLWHTNVGTPDARHRKPLLCTPNTGGAVIQCTIPFVGNHKGNRSLLSVWCHKYGTCILLSQVCNGKGRTQRSRDYNMTNLEQ